MAANSQGTDWAAYFRLRAEDGGGLHISAAERLQIAALLSDRAASARFLAVGYVLRNLKGESFAAGSNTAADAWRYLFGHYAATLAEVKSHEEAGWRVEECAASDRAAMQAQIDRLMLEYCPEEMTPEQVENWGRHQKAAPLESGASVQSPGRDSGASPDGAARCAPTPKGNADLVKRVRSFLDDKPTGDFDMSDAVDLLIEAADALDQRGQR